jgi:GntR family transcriptional regulator/MocR family aminotransferase
VTPLADLLAPCLDEDPGTPLYRRLYLALRQAILDGRVRQRLPSTRRLAADLGISRNSVAAAFDLLQAEGYLSGRIGSGSYVADHLPDQAPASPSHPAAAPPEPRRLAQRVASLPRALHEQEPAAPFAITPLAWADFPWPVWSRLLARPWRRPAAALVASPDRAGLPALRRAVAEMLGATRAMNCSPDQVLITAGSQQALDIACRLLLDPGERVMVEDPGFFGMDAAILAAGGVPVPQAVDGEGLLVPGDLSGIRAVQVTPSRNFPLGSILSLPRRLALLQAASAADCWILEDDFDAEFRYAGRPLASLFGLDRDRRVLYAGTFSRTLFPGLRLGYLVVPEVLIGPARAVRDAADGGIGTPAQAALAAFIAEGHYGAHLRRQRLKLAEARSALIALLPAKLGDVLEIIPTDGGLSLTALFRDAVDDAQAVASLAAIGIAARPLSAFYRAGPPRPGLVLSFAGWPRAAIETALDRMAAAADWKRGRLAPFRAPAPGGRQ